MSSLISFRANPPIMWDGGEMNDVVFHPESPSAWFCINSNSPRGFCTLKWQSCSLTWDFSGGKVSASWRSFSYRNVFFLMFLSAKSLFFIKQPHIRALEKRKKSSWQFKEKRFIPFHPLQRHYTLCGKNANTYIAFSDFPQDIDF